MPQRQRALLQQLLRPSLWAWASPPCMCTRLLINAGLSSSVCLPAEALKAQEKKNSSSASGGRPARRWERRPLTAPKTASGPVIKTTAPWPWVDPLRTFVLPQLVENGMYGSRPPRPGPVNMQEAVRQLKANVDASVKGTPAALFSGRPRLKADPGEAVEVDLLFNVEPRDPDQMVRGTLVLPHGRGRTVRVGVFATGASAEAAREAGAFIVGGEALIQQIIDTEGEAITFDALVASPEFMKPLARAGRFLGPKGLMPNPKMGTLTSDVAAAVKELLAGKLEYRVSRDKQMRLVVGRASFSEQQLHQNLTAIVDSLIETRPKKLPLQGYIKRMFLKSTQTPPIAVDVLSCASSRN